jgi:hypothetical protein
MRSTRCLTACLAILQTLHFQQGNSHMAASQAANLASSAPRKLALSAYYEVQYLASVQQPPKQRWAPRCDARVWSTSAASSPTNFQHLVLASSTPSLKTAFTVHRCIVLYLGLVYPHDRQQLRVRSTDSATLESGADACDVCAGA